MERIATATKAVDLFGSGKHGFTEGVPATATPPTHLSDDWFNAVQEELANFIEGQGITLVPGTYTQLLAALRAPVGPASTSTPAIAGTGGSTNGTGITGQGGGTSGKGLAGTGANHTTSTAGVGTVGAGGTATTGTGGIGTQGTGGAASGAAGIGGAGMVSTGGAASNGASGLGGNGITATGGASTGSTGGAGGSFTGGSPGGKGVTGAGTTTGAGGAFTSGATDASIGVTGTSAATNGVGGKFTGTGTGDGAYGLGIDGYGVRAESDTTTPAKAALRIVPQGSADPATSPAAGDTYVHSSSGRMSIYDGTEWGRIPSKVTAIITDDTLSPTGGTFVDFATGTYNIPANTLRAGAKIKVHAAVIASSAAGAGNVDYGFECNDGSVLTTTTRTVSTAEYVVFEMTGVVRVIGGSGSIEWSGHVTFGPSDNPDISHAIAITAALDTTAAVRLEIEVHAANSSNTFLLKNFTVDISD